MIELFLCIHFNLLFQVFLRQNRSSLDKYDPDGSWARNLTLTGIRNTLPENRYEFGPRLRLFNVVAALQFLSTDAGVVNLYPRDTLPWTSYIRQLVSFFTVVDYAANFHAGISGSVAGGLKDRMAVEVARAALDKA